LLKEEANRVRTTERSGAAATRDRMVAAAVETLKREGFGGSTARAIAQTGGFNQALIFYHFGTLHQLLLAALDRTSTERMERYRSMASEARDFPGLLRVAAEVYGEDLRSGHIKVLAEMIAGASSEPELGPEIVRRVEPWIEFATSESSRVLEGSSVEGAVPAEDVAYAVVALYLGIELLAHLEGDTARADRLFALAQNLAAVLGPALGLGGTSQEGGHAR
jgi:AcrR family transcriptional regulator